MFGGNGADENIMDHQTFCEIQRTGVEIKVEKLDCPGVLGMEVATLLEGASH